MSFNPKLQYILVKQGKEFFILAEKRLGEFVARSDTEIRTLLSFPGDSLEGFAVQKPFRQPGSIPLLQDGELKPTFGTGLRSVTPAHSIDALRFSYMHNLSRDGCIDPHTGKLNQPVALSDLKPSDEGFID